MKFLLGTKVNMTQIFDEKGIVHPATVIKTGPMTVTQVKTVETDGYNAVQVGFGTKASKNINKALKGHMKEGNYAHLVEFRLDDVSAFKVGETVPVSFVAGDIVTTSSISKGKGFQGGVKRHGFKGGITFFLIPPRLWAL
jgi:large subunit ribosomal protein L3